MEYAPVMEATLAERSRLTRPGSSTLPKAIPVPISIVPTYNVHTLPVERSKMPKEMIVNAPKSVRSSPNFRATGALSGENAANASNGNEVSRPTAEELKPKSLWISGRTGAILVKGSRRLTAIKRIPATSATVFHLFLVSNMFSNLLYFRKKSTIKYQKSV